jgi:hypothetical protein
MAKKTRKAVKTNRPIVVQPEAGEQAATPATAVAAPRSRPVSSASPRTFSMAQATITFREEYHYVIADLKRTAILATFMFAAMIVLALVLAR